MSDDRGVRCPKCNCGHCEVVRTSQAPLKTRRRRRCRHCGHLFVTSERVERAGELQKGADLRESEGRAVDARPQPRRRRR